MHDLKSCFDPWVCHVGSLFPAAAILFPAAAILFQAVAILDFGCQAAITFTGVHHQGVDAHLGIQGNPTRSLPPFQSLNRNLGHLYNVSCCDTPVAFEFCIFYHIMVLSDISLFFIFSTDSWFIFKRFFIFFMTFCYKNTLDFRLKK